MQLYTRVARPMIASGHENHPNCSSRSHTGPLNITHSYAKRSLSNDTHAKKRYTPINQFHRTRNYSRNHKHIPYWRCSSKLPYQAETGDNWCTDGSKTQEGVEASIYAARTMVTTPLGLVQNATVFQAELAAIERLAGELAMQKASRSQGVLKMLRYSEVSSKLVWSC